MYTQVSAQYKSNVQEYEVLSWLAIRVPSYKSS